MDENLLPWVWWERDEPEDGLTGFHTKEDRDRFSKGGDGPFRRRISADGHTTSQTWQWDDMMSEVRRLLDDEKATRP